MLVRGTTLVVERVSSPSKQPLLAVSWGSIFCTILWMPCINLDLAVGATQTLSEAGTKILD